MDDAVNSRFETPTDSYDWCISEKGARVKSLQTVITKLNDVQEAIQSLGEQGLLVDGHVLSLSNQLRDAFKACEGVHIEATNIGALTVGFTALLNRPQDAAVPTITCFFSDRGFCVTLRNLKIEQLRISQGNPQQGPELNNYSCTSVEMWGAELTDGIMSVWEKMLWNHVDSDNRNRSGTPTLVSRAFAMTVCNLIFLQLNLWPRIKIYLDKWNIRGHHMYPFEMWENKYLNEVMLLEPRFISFVANAGHVDMNEIAREGPARRSETSRTLWQTLKPEQRMLLNNGVEYIRNECANNQYLFQGVHWNATLYDWPRETLPGYDDLIKRVLD